MVAARASIDVLATAVRQLTLAVQEQDRRLTAYMLLTAAEIPAWTTRTEVEEGDDMGMVIKGADTLGLVVEYVDVRHQPGFSHDDVVSIDPAPGTLVPRGSTVRVTINLKG